MDKRPLLIDSHTHVQFSKFDKDRDEVIKRSFDNGIWMVNVGADKESSIKAVELAEKYQEGIYVTVGVHPHDAESEFDYEFFKNLALNPKVVAIGECGLDYFFNQQLTTNKLQQIKEKQKKLFIKQIGLSKEINKPLMIHCREAFDDLIVILKSCFLFTSDTPGTIHFFTGDKENAEQLLKMGFYFTFNGLITYNRQFDEIIKIIPLDKILIETDAPWVAPEPHRGKRNEPLYVVEVAQKIAEIKNISQEKFYKQVTENNFKIFNL